MSSSSVRPVFWGIVVALVLIGCGVGDDNTPLKNPLRGDEQPAAEPVNVSASPAATGARTATFGKGQHSGQKFDPVKENGEFFKEKQGENLVDWPAPKFALVITGRQDGYLEPCGCAGMDRMKGGLMRRHSFLEELRQTRQWPVVAVDVGSLVKGFGRQTLLKFQTTVNALLKMDYAAIAFGRYDLKLTTGELVSVAAGTAGKPSPFVSANVGLFGSNSGLMANKRIVEAGGMKVGITSVLGKTYQGDINISDIEFTDPEAAIRRVLADLQKEKCDVLVLLAHATKDESVELARKFPEFDVVVTAGGSAEPPQGSEKVDKKTLLIDVGEKGMAAVVLGFYADQVRYQRVLLDSRYKSSPVIRSLFSAYQSQLKELGLAELGVRAVPYRPRDVLGDFVGSAKCESCHEQSYKVWKKSGHSKAYATLAKADPPRNFDPECIACHVVGWQRVEKESGSDYFPYQGGFSTQEKTPHLTDVGCESCHGAGGAHCDAEMKNDKALQEKLQKAMVVTKAEAEKRMCMTCHDLDNSPDFDFSAYWPQVEHHEKEK